MRRFGRLLLALALNLWLLSSWAGGLAVGAPTGRWSYLADSGCDQILFVLDEVRVAIANDPQPSLIIIAHPGPRTMPGLVRRHLEYARGYIASNIRGNSPDLRIGVGHDADEFTIEIIRLGEQTVAPLNVQANRRYGQIVGKYDEASLYVMHSEDGWTIGMQICSLEFPAIDGFVEALRLLPGSRAVVVLHPGRDPSEGGVAGARKALRSILAGRLRSQSTPLVFRVGETRQWFMASFYVVPAGVDLESYVVTPPN